MYITRTFETENTDTARIEPGQVAIIDAVSSCLCTLADSLHKLTTCLLIKCLTTGFMYNYTIIIAR